MTRDGWLEPGDVVQAGDYCLLSSGEFLKMDSGGYTHKAKHNPKWRQPGPPGRDERMRVLGRWIAEQERIDAR